MSKVKTVLSIPNHGHENRYFRLFCEALEGRSLKVIGIRNPDAFRFRFDILHIHFPAHFITQSPPVLAILWALILLSWFSISKILGKRIVYSVHDVMPLNLQNAWLLRPYIAIFHCLCDGFAFLSASSQDDFYKKFPTCRSKLAILVPHGPYPTVRATTEQRTTMRSELGLSESDVVVGMLGSIKPYKNIEAIRLLPLRMGAGRQVKVLVAGKIEASYFDRANAILSEIPERHLIRIDRSPSDEELDLLIQTCDVCFLPYTRSSNSGAALLVLSNYSLLLTSDLPIFKELQCSVPGGWVHTFDLSAQDPYDLVRALGAAVFGSAGRNDTDQVLTGYLNEVSFDRTASKLVKFYNSLARVSESRSWLATSSPDI